MKRYVVTFQEIRRYEMIVDAPNEETAIRWSRQGPENPLWVGVDLENYEATEIGEVAP